PPAWCRATAVAGAPFRWRVPNFWLAPAWPAVSVYCGITAPPIVYDYGSTAVIQNDYVYVNGTQMGTAQQYAEQATTFADQGRAATPPKDEEWQPLGVFGLIQPDEKIAQGIFQLAENKAGERRGNCYHGFCDDTAR